jgi:putative transposase
MPSRLKRYQQEDHYHFITFSCYRRLPYLHNDPARIIFEETLEQVRQRHKFYLFGYVVMPEHVHLLISEPEHQSLAATMRVLKGETSKHLKGERKQFWIPSLLRLQRFHARKISRKAEVHAPQSHHPGTR